MRLSSILIAVSGIAIAGGSVYMAATMSREPVAAAIAAPSQAPESTTMVDVWVAAVDIEYGQAISAELLTTQTWPVEAVPAGAFTSLEALVKAGSDPRRAVRPLAQGEVMLPSKVSDFGETVTIVQKLGANSRAVAIQVDAVTGVGGFVTPGDRVDVVLTQGRAEDLRAATILQDIRVVGVDQKAEYDADNMGVARTITVEVTPQDGQKLALAQRAGTLSLTLRTLDAVADDTLRPITIADILGDAPVEVATPQAAKPTIKIRRGGKESIVALTEAQVSTPSDSATDGAAAGQ